ncbi:MAG: hypothetical protein RKE49_13750 [Oceanicaulis sp.]
MEHWIRRAPFIIAAAAAALWLSGCTDLTDRFVRAMADDEAVALGDQALDALFSRDEAALRSMLHDEAAPAFTAEAFQQTFGYLPETPTQTRRLLQVNWSSFTDQAGSARRLNLLYHISFAPEAQGAVREEFARIGLAARGDASLQLVELHLFPAPGPAVGEPVAWPVGFWAAVILTPFTALFCIAALISVWRTPRLKRRILWTIFIALIGYPVFAYSTQTGAWVLQSPGVSNVDGGVNVSFINITVLSAAWMKDMITGHHLFQVAVPVGALFFFVQKARGKLALKPAKGQSSKDALASDTPSDPVPPR